MSRKPLLFVLALFGVQIGGAVQAAAEIHDYMIRRLLHLKTSCGVQHLTRLESGKAERRFKAVCRDVNAYPDGVVVVCTDTFDDRSCMIESTPRSFDSLELLRPRE
ncbi:hypothetical protein [Hyphomicrobium sp. LHD-15]|uniref:hypothetical protein n=1 Tax=Hyphomicrobium sp. LHD-15 TaxID=3072142 RepID=UPI00280D13F3|nr:hypothetical protein [Hyphomicrobium sp. LHD-15]MDQ8698473.1 hypothetical protein [Hyphomicrobium sp. LHD-15]